MKSLINSNSEVAPFCSSILGVTSTSGEHISLLVDGKDSWHIAEHRNGKGGKTRDRSRSPLKKDSTKEDLLESFASTFTALPAKPTLSISITVSPLGGLNSKYGHTIREIIQSEETFCKCLAQLGKFYLDPLLLRCQTIGLECTPLINLREVVTKIHTRHLKFHKSMVSNPSASNFAKEVENLLRSQTYSHFELYSTLIKHLVKSHTLPFEVGFSEQIQRFLEQNQPQGRNMDLSFLLLIQKPLSRITKYPMFLHNLRPQLDYKRKFAKFKEQLDLINMGIGNNAERIKELQSIHFSMAHPAAIKNPFYFGLLKHCSQNVTIKLQLNGRNIWSLKKYQVLVFERHLLIVDSSKAHPIFCLPMRSFHKEDGIHEKESSCMLRFHGAGQDYLLCIAFDLPEKRNSFSKELRKPEIQAFQILSHVDRDSFICVPGWWASRCYYMTGTRSGTAADEHVSLSRRNSFKNLWRNRSRDKY